MQANKRARNPKNPGENLMKAVVMAGGTGSRLRPITIERPKPMITIVNKPVIGHILSLLKHHGITDVTITVQYLSKMIQDYFGDGSSLGMKITYCIEDEPLGTAGGVKNVQNLIDDTFLVLMGDALIDFDLNQIIAFHKQKQAIATITLCHVPDPLEFGVIITNNEGYVSQFLEKPTWGEVFSDTVNTGIYVLEPEIFDWIPENEPYDFSHQLFPKLLTADKPIAGYVAEGYWCDIGNISTLRQATADLLEGKAKGIDLGTHIGGNIWVGGDVEISPKATLFGPIFLGNSVKIKDEAVIHGPTVVRDYTVIDERAQIDRSIIWRNCYIGKGVELRGAMVLRHCNLKAKSVVYEGVVIGDGTIVGEGAVIHPNVKIWAAKNIEPGAIVKNSVIWGSQGRRILFGRQGVTGMINIDLTPEFSAKLGAAFGSIFPKGSLVFFNRDPHPGPRMLKRGAISGLPSAGIRVLDLAEQPIPVARYFTRVSDVQACVHVCLSQFDKRVVNILFFDERGLNISKDMERQIERVFFREDFRRVYTDEIGTIGYASGVVETYMKGFLQAIDVEAIRRANFNLVVDYASGPTVRFLPQILTELGCSVVALNADQNPAKMITSFDAHEAALDRLRVITKALEPTFGVRIDVAGEYISAVDDRGNNINHIDLCAAMAELALSADPGKAIAISANLPYTFEAIAARHGGRVIRSKVDAYALMEASLEKDIVMAGGSKGNFIFPSFQPSYDGMMAIAKLLEFLVLQNRRFSDVLADLPPYYLARSQVYCLWETKGVVLRKLREQFEGQLTKSVEGLRIVLDEQEWVLILPSPDEPYINIIAEASSQTNADKLVQTYAKLVKDLQP
jgi:mannose-1-phosphate guanylyltransferase/phosphomannomutase